MATVTVADNLKVNWTDSVSATVVRTGVNVSKLVSYSVLDPTIGISVTKLVTYIILEYPSVLLTTDTLVMSDAVSTNVVTLSNDKAVADSLNNWLDGLQLFYGQVISVSDTLTLSDAIATNVLLGPNIPEPVSDSLNNWADSTGNLITLVRFIEDSLNNFLDVITRELGYFILKTDSFSFSDAVARYSPLGNLFITITDNFIVNTGKIKYNWKDGLSVSARPDYTIFFALDDLSNFLRDEIVVSFVIFFNSSSIMVNDTLSSWNDSINQRAVLPGIIGDALQFSDTLGLHLDGYAGVEDSLGMQDRIFIQVPTLPIGSDDLNNWNDSISMGEFGNEEIMVGDNLNYWADGTNEYKATAFSSYIRRYLNDTIH